MAGPKGVSTKLIRERYHARQCAEMKERNLAKAAAKRSSVAKARIKKETEDFRDEAKYTKAQKFNAVTNRLVDRIYDDVQALSDIKDKDFTNDLFNKQIKAHTAHIRDLLTIAKQMEDMIVLVTKDGTAPDEVAMKDREALVKAAGAKVAQIKSKLKGK